MTTPAPPTHDVDSLDLRALSDAELMLATNFYRTLTSRDADGAAAMTHAHESELSRRFGGLTTLGAPLEQPRPPLRRWWRASR